MRSLVLLLITVRVLFGIWSNIAPAKVAGHNSPKQTAIALGR